MGDYSALRRTYLPDEYRRDTALHNVVATVHVEAECDRSQQVAETRWLTEIAARHGMPNAIVAHAWIDTPNAEEILVEHKKVPTGMRHPHQAHHLRGARPRSDARPASQHAGPQVAQRPVAVAKSTTCRGTCAWVWWHLRKRPRWCASIHGLRTVLSHTGYPLDRSPEGASRHGPGMQALAACPGVWCKISGLVVRTKPWTLAANKPHHSRHKMRIFGVATAACSRRGLCVGNLKGSWTPLYSQFKRAVADFPLADHPGCSPGMRRVHRIELQRSVQL
mgnify:CR=1 FL=1